jgi:Na+-driven multidrug efflux pump
MRYVVIAMFAAIVASLGSAAIFMVRGRGDSRRMARALAWRVGLSVALFVLLIAGYALGLIRPGNL